MKTLHKFPRNKIGRDFVVGDIHGAFTALDEAMDIVKFDRVHDRLFMVGDLIDRGPDSARCVEFLEQSFVHAVRGNHEDMLLDIHCKKDSSTSNEQWIDGAEWWVSSTVDVRRRIVATLRRLPLAIEVDTPRGSVGFVHAEVPIGMDWTTFCAALEKGDSRVIGAALWGRNRITRGDTSGVEGIGRVFVGHTVQSGGMKRYGNVYAIDTGAIFCELWSDPDKGLTMVDVQATTADLDLPRQVARIDVRGAKREMPSLPFGNHVHAPSHRRPNSPKTD